MMNEDITINKLIMFALENSMLEKQKESQCLVVIDEAGGRFNCRDFQKTDRAEWIDFFSQHRKLGFDFVLVAQNDRMLDRQIRGYIETEIKHRKMNNFGPFWMLPFPAFVCVEHWYTAKQRVGSSMFLYSKKLSDRYDTMQLFSGFKLSNELLDLINAKRKGLELNANNDLDVSINAVYGKEEND